MSDIYRTYIKPGRTRLIMTDSHRKMSGFDRNPNRFESIWFDDSHFHALKFISLDSVFRVIRGQDRQVQRKRHVFWNVLVCTLMESRPQIIVLDRCAQMTVI